MIKLHPQQQLPRYKTKIDSSNIVELHAYKGAHFLSVAS